MSTTNATTNATYSADQIEVLEGLEAVRKRPGMYIGSTSSTGLHHCVWEIFDNSVDEAMAGHCSRITVRLLADGACEVTDDGRGIPVDVHAQLGVSGVELALTRLHAGGKFGGGGYKVSGGLHGVGVSVVNALSRRLEATVWRDGVEHFQAFHLDTSGPRPVPGAPVAPLAPVGPASPKGRTGTRIAFWPDPTIFETVEFSARTITDRLQTAAFLNRGLRIDFVDERPGKEAKATFESQGGIEDFVGHLNATKSPLFATVGSFRASGPEGDVEVAWQWNTGTNEGLHGFANGISTVDGGTHLEGFKRALTQQVNQYAKAKGALKGTSTWQGDDIREGLTAIVSVRLSEPQFEGQTKGKLGNSEIKTLLERTTTEALRTWLEEHPKEAKAILDKAQVAARSRAAAAAVKQTRTRKSALDGAGLPGKLTDCNTRGNDGELFIVEGDSASGTAKSARNPANQAILPLKGKPLNVERATMDKIVANTEIQSLITAIGAGIGRVFELERARYDKIVILADADVDGGHITVLLLTFFYRQMRPLVEAGRVFVAMPPLYTAVVGGEKTYLADDRARDEFMANPKHAKAVITRLKGLGEMDASELKVTVMDPATRRLARIGVEQATQADEMLSLLMGDDASQRRAWIERNADSADLVDI